MNGIRVVALMDANTLTGPAKNLLRFCRLVRERSAGLCEISLISVLRAGPGYDPASNPFICAARAIPIDVDIIREQHRFEFQVITRLRRTLRQRSPNLIQSHGLKAHFLTGFCRSGGERWLAYHHGYTAEDWKMRLYNQLDRWSLPRADRVVTVCGPFATMLERKGVSRDRIRILPNSIEPEVQIANEAAAIRREWQLPDQARVVLAIGRLSPEKGHRDLIEAARIVRERNPALFLHVVLVGDGPERVHLTRQIQAAGLEERVLLAGQQRNPLPYYGAADLFVLPSHSEGSPNVLLEAMAAGVPIVACQVGGVPESVAHEESALLVKPGDPTALALAIVRLLENPVFARTLAENACAAVRERHSPEAYCDSLLEIYRDLLAT